MVHEMEASNLANKEVCSHVAPLRGSALAVAGQISFHSMIDAQV